MTDNGISKLILIVEGDQTLNDALRQRLETEGFRVMCAFNGEEGFTAAETYHHDLILLDILMPVMNGYEMYNRIMEKTWGQRIKVIFLSNVTDAGGWLNVLGGSEYLVKSSWSLNDVVLDVKAKLNIGAVAISSRSDEIHIR